MIIDNFRFIDIGDDRVVFNEGDEGNQMFIVQNGAVKTSIRIADGSERELALFKQGDFFGEMSIFDNSPRSATCRTVENSSLICLKEEDLFSMIEQNPEIAIKIMYRMLNITTQRLRDTGEFLSDLVQWGEAARKRTVTDELTGVYNRRFLDDSLPKFVESAKRRSKPLTLAMVDLDHFRLINETYGHDAGDKVILEVIGVFNNHLRETDVMARYGGDEFTVFYTDMPAQEALEVAERIRTDVEKLAPLPGGAGVCSKVTISQGLASIPESAGNAEDLKKKADLALYRAKEEGRNKVYYAIDGGETYEKKNDTDNP